MKPVYVSIKWEELPNSRCEDVIKRGISSVSIINGEEVSKKDNVYCVSEYSRNENELMYIGILDDNATSIEVEGKFGFHRKFQRVNENIWLFVPNYKWSARYNEYVSELPSFGLNQCGFFVFNSYDSQNQLQERFELKVQPSLMTEDEYIDMQEDLLIMVEELYNNHGEVNQQVTILDVNELLNKVKILKSMCLEIEQTPSEKLVYIDAYIPVDKVKKYNTKLLLERELYPFKSKVRGSIIEKSIDIEEHRKLKGVLREFLAMFHRNYNRENRMYVNLQQERHIISTNMAKMLSGNARDQEQIRSNFKRKLTYLDNKMIQYKHRVEIWKEIKKEIEEILHFEVFSTVEEEDWGETHLFQFSPMYIEVYDLIEEIKVFSKYQNELKSFQQDLITSPSLYEKWVFFKVIHTLNTVFKFSCSKPVQQMLDYYSTYSTLEEFHVDMHNGRYKVSVCSEWNMDGMKPDISIYFRLLDSNGEVIQKMMAFLDAKYKPYSHWPMQLSDDLTHSAIRYRESLDYAKCAFLVHPDEDLKDNFEEARPHEYGYFLLKPSKTSSLILYFKMLMHFQLGWEKICPDCGAIGKVVTDEGYKKYYECDACNSFWVQNVCWNSNKHNVTETIFSIRNGQESIKKLYKYLNKNYHTETTFDWDVYCPRCNKCFRDRFANDNTYFED